MLAKINWTFFVKEPQYKDSLENLVQCLRNDIESSQLAPLTQREDENEEDEEDEEDYSPRVEHMSHAPMGLFGECVIGSGMRREASSIRNGVAVKMFGDGWMEVLGEGKGVWYIKMMIYFHPDFIEG